MPTAQEIVGSFDKQGAMNKLLADGLTAEAAELRIRTYLQDRVNRLSTPVQDVSGPVESLVIGAGRGLTNIGEGFQQMALDAVVPGKDTGFQQEAQQERNEFNSSPVGRSTLGDIGEFLGEAIPTLLVPGGVAGGAATRAATSGIAGAAIMGTSFVEEGESRIDKAMGGLGGGIFGSTLFSAGSKIMNNLGRRYRGLNRTNEELGEIGRKHKIFADKITDPFIGELTNNRVYMALEETLDMIPLVGLMRDRQKQAASLVKDAQNLLTQFPTVDNYGFVIQQSMKDVLKKNKKVLGGLYGDVNKLVGEMGDPSVRTTNLQAAARSVLEEAQTSNNIALDAGTRRMLVKAMDPSATAAARQSPILDASGQSLRTAPSDMMSFAELEGKRIALLKREQAASGGATPNFIQAAQLRKVRQGIDEDIAQFTQDAGVDIDKAYGKARQYFIDNVLPFRARDFRTAIDGADDLENVIGAFIKGSNIEGQGRRNAQRLKDNLNVKGQQALEYGIMAQAFERSHVEGLLDVKKLGNELRKLSTANGVVMHPDKLKQIDGMVAMVDIAKRAASLTGKQAPSIRTTAIAPGGVAALSFLFGGQGLLGVEIVATTLATKMLGTTAGRKLLTNMHNAGNNATAQNAVMKQIDKFAEPFTKKVFGRGGAVIGGEFFADEE